MGELYDHEGMDETAWDRHDGGSKPANINPETIVLLVYRDGLKSAPIRAGSLRWEHTGICDDIMAYRLLHGQRN